MAKIREQWEIDMFGSMRELMGEGFVPSYYEQLTQPFITIAKGEIEFLHDFYGEQNPDDC